jgi:hypothetical protein
VSVAIYRHCIGPRPASRGDDIFSLARRLLADGTVAAETRLETWRGEALVQHGIAGELAKWEVVGSKFRPVKERPPA